MDVSSDSRPRRDPTDRLPDDLVGAFAAAYGRWATVRDQVVLRGEPDPVVVCHTEDGEVFIRKRLDRYLASLFEEADGSGL
jgi:hypothetical protein